MNSDLLRAITPDEVGTYHRDGVLLLSGMFDKDWIELLNKGIDTNIKTPTRGSRIWYKDTSGRSMFYDHTAWQNIFSLCSNCAQRNEKNFHPTKKLGRSGGSDGTRTYDPLGVNEMLYQLS